MNDTLYTTINEIVAASQEVTDTQPINFLIDKLKPGDEILGTAPVAVQYLVNYCFEIMKLKMESETDYMSAGISVKGERWALAEYGHLSSLIHDIQDKISELLSEEFNILDRTYTNFTLPLDHHWTVAGRCEP
jgi:hypothetical protein